MFYSLELGGYAISILLYHNMIFQTIAMVNKLTSLTKAVLVDSLAGDDFSRLSRRT